MNERLAIDVLVTDWLQADAPAHAPVHLLPDALVRVADLPQERHLTQRLFGDRVGRSPRVRWALAVVLLALALAGAVAIAGTLLPRPPRPSGPPTNGWIVFSANGEAGPTLALTPQNVRGGDPDIYIVREGSVPQRIVGTDTDTDSERCPRFSPDGTKLAYLVLDSTSVTPSVAPVPEGQTFAPAAPDAGPLRWAIVLQPVGTDGIPTGGIARVTPQGAPNALFSCPTWSPDGSRLAYTTDAPDGSKELWVTTLDGRATRLQAPSPSVNELPQIAWAPDNTRIAYASVDGIWAVPVDGTPSRVLATAGTGVSWSPDGTRIATWVDGSIQLRSSDGALVDQVQVGTPRGSALAFVWSPDGQRVAYASGRNVVVLHPNGTVDRVLPITDDLVSGMPDPGASLIGWSPDGTRLLVALGVADGEGEIVALPIDGSKGVVLTPPTLALRGLGAQSASWQVVYP